MQFAACGWLSTNGYTAFQRRRNYFDVSSFFRNYSGVTVCVFGIAGIIPVFDE